MPEIRPIKDLINTNEISELCHELNEPVYITKNGYGHSVVMSMVENNYSVHLTNIAMGDLDEVYRYISEELFSENAATGLLGRIESSIFNLATFPYSGSLPNDNI